MTKLLIVDDEKWVRDTIKVLVKQASSPIKHIEMVEAKNGIEALDFINIVQPDIVITDMKMPGIDGKELLEIVGNNHPHLPVIVLSGYHDFVYTKQAIKSRVIEYLLKPVDEMELYQAIEKSIEVKTKLEHQHINYQMLSIDRPEISNVIHPFLKSVYYDVKELNTALYLKHVQQFSNTIGISLKMDESFTFHLQQKFLITMEEMMHDHQLRLDDLKINLSKLHLNRSATFEQVIGNQVEIVQAIITTIERNKSLKKKLNLEEIKQYVDQHYDVPEMSLDVVAKTFFISKEYLTTVFKKKYGYNITEYIISLRMEKAKQLVVNTTMQYKTIAEKVGYEDPPYFYRVFKKYYHISPGEMRKT
ncbi:response regulator [Lederbergia lenta]|uniref:response regulator n=1 Tax=Lederbergia lenta TaxID=1467 RepID=UPI00203EB338|nr:response regulator [Lederbergia lenta]MCM3111711.1 response regulator [Lederbergia lenta]